MNTLRCKILIFDYDDKIMMECKKKMGSYPEFLFADKSTEVREFIKNNKIKSIVSPANSSGFMDGGIDYYYSVLFKDIQTTVQNKIKTYEIYLEEKKRYGLPIGSAFAVPTGHPNCPELICAPTMVEPDDIRGTKNVYYAFMAILKVCRAYGPDDIVAIPGLGTGTGQITPQEMASQIHQAFIDFKSGYHDTKVMVDKDREYVFANHK